MELMVVVFIIGVLVTTAVPAWQKARESSRRSSCLSNLQKIDQAKNLWAIENRKHDGDAVTQANLFPDYIKSNWPVCPAGGTLTIGAIGANPSCSEHGAN